MFVAVAVALVVVVVVVVVTLGREWIEKWINSYNQIIITNFLAVSLRVTVIFTRYSMAFLSSLFIYHQSKPIVTSIYRIADTLLCMMYYMLNVELFISHQLVAYEEHFRFYVMDAQLFLRLRHYLTGNQDMAQPLSLSLTHSITDWHDIYYL